MLRKWGDWLGWKELRKGIHLNSSPWYHFTLKKIFWEDKQGIKLLVKQHEAAEGALQRDWEIDFLDMLSTVLNEMGRSLPFAKLCSFTLKLV